jgi:hypothetical protein
MSPCYKKSPDAPMATQPALYGHKTQLNDKADVIAQQKYD